MRRIRLAALALCTLAAVVPATADAGPPVDGPYGTTCGLSSGADPFGEPGVNTGFLYGGPMVSTAGPGTLSCYVQLGANDTHAEAHDLSVYSNSGDVAAVSPVAMSYWAAPGDPVWLCTEFRYDGGPTLYWHSDNAGSSGHWSADASSQCKLGIAAGDGLATIDPDVSTPSLSFLALTDRYVVGGTLVYRSGTNTVVDNGGAICNPTLRAGSGGICVPFTGGNAVGVTDGVQGENVAFQVCVDNNHDNVCGFNPLNAAASIGPCADDIAFSHGDDGAFHNPVGPVVTGFRPGCARPGGARSWNGYVVILCEGLHDTHPHPATTGTARVTGGPEGVGDFCGVPNPAPGKFYTVV